MGKLIDLKDQRFGFWIVLKQDINNKSGKTQWLCECECGNQKLITSNSLRTGNSTSCGCNHAPDLTNNKFGDLIVIQKSHSKGRRYWICKCKCGSKITYSTKELRDGSMLHCGCKTNKIKKVKAYYSESLVENISSLQHSIKKLQDKIQHIMCFEKTAQELLSNLNKTFCELNDHNGN